MIITDWIYDVIRPIGTWFKEYTLLQNTKCKLLNKGNTIPTLYIYSYFAVLTVPWVK